MPPDGGTTLPGLGRLAEASGLARNAGVGSCVAGGSVVVLRCGVECVMLGEVGGKEKPSVGCPRRASARATRFVAERPHPLVRETTLPGRAGWRGG